LAENIIIGHRVALRLYHTSPAFSQIWQHGTDKLTPSAQIALDKWGVALKDLLFL